ncbi:MAG: glycosyltransferase [Candidatus Korarchaeum sp.]|nr:glycosyltransferase [Candidatus Korarchaeum sp.]
MAVLIPVYNEPPSLVVQTALAASIALEDSEDVYVLDDSTDRSVISELDRYSREYGFKLFRRKNRRGYKAGALNDWLREFGSHYDFLMILDSDQRPLPGILRYALRFFDDPEVAFVQVPQYYSSLDTMVALSAHIQQIPFLRVVMRGRHLNGSSFSLGSGTIFKVRSLLGMGFYEESITEDVHTSLSLHERGLKSVYIDLPLVWHGEAPQDMLSYWTQQNRWALGSFQLLGRLLKSRISLIKFLDYLVGLFYWLHIGPLTLVNIMAPVIFLSTGIPFIMVHPLSYLSIYVPILLLSLIIFLVSTRPYRYGIREFLLHQGIQLVASLPVTLAFFQWLGKRKAAFRVTPKGRVRRSFTPYHLYFLVILSLLLASIIIGSVSLSHLRSALFYAYLVNLCWACWWFSIVSFALYVSLARRSPPEVREKVRQTYEGLEGLVISMISCAMALESSLAGYYGMLSKTFPEYSKELEKISEDSSRHYRILRETLSVLGIRDVQERDCLWIKRYLDKVDRLERECGEMMSEECLLVQEEFIMYVFTQLVIESCRSLSLGVRGIESISEDELRHESTLRDILRTLGPSEGTLSR